MLIARQRATRVVERRHCGEKNPPFCRRATTLQKDFRRTVKARLNPG
jgi:hypothetical protein